MMNRSKTLAALLILALDCGVLFAATHAKPRVRVHQADSFKLDTNVKRIPLDVASQARSASLRLAMEARSGSISWRLLDPSGAVRDEGVVEGTRGVYETDSFDPEAGQWTLELSTTAASGSYDLCWKIW